MLMAGFFRAEPIEGRAADMVTLFADALPAGSGRHRRRHAVATAAGARGRRAHDGRKAAESRDPQRFSVRQLARLGNHSLAAVRRFVLDTFAADEARFRADPQNAVLLVESEWDDVRAIAVNRLTAWPSDALPAAALAVMAD